MAAQCSRGAWSTWPGLRVSGVSCLSSDTTPHKIIQVEVLADILSNHCGCHTFSSNGTRQHEQQVINTLSPGQLLMTWYRIVARVFAVKLLSGECHRAPLPEKSTLPQVMAWCRQAPSHYLSQCFWPDLFHHMALPGHDELIVPFLTHWEFPLSHETGIMIKTRFLYWAFERNQRSLYLGFREIIVLIDLALKCW